MKPGLAASGSIAATLPVRKKGDKPTPLLEHHMNQSSEIRQWILPVLLGLPFGLVTIQNSLHQGQLSVPITYDDIGYFNDALTRLQSIYDHGWLVAISDYIAYPPHSPFSTFVAFLAFVLLGVEDWGPAAIRVLLIIAILAILQRRLKDAPRWAFVCIAIAIFGWPLMGALIIESRPDIFCALVTAFALISIVGGPWLNSSIGHTFRVSCLIGIAVLAKPSISLLTILLYFAAITLASIGELYRRPAQFDKAFTSNLFSMAVVAGISLAYFPFAWRSVYDYIKAATFSSTSYLWVPKLNPTQTALYYLTGEAGHSMIGSWLLGTIVILCVALWVGTYTKYAFDWWRILRTATIAFLTYLCVTIPHMKSVFLGVIVACTVFVIFIEVTIFIVNQLVGTGKTRLLALLLVGLTVFSLSTFNWGARSGVIEFEPALTAERQKELLTDVAHEIAIHSNGNSKVFFTAATQYFNADTLNFEFLRKRYRGLEAAGAPLDDTMSSAAPALKTANFVITFSHDNTEVLELPNATILRAQNEAIEQQSDLKLVKIFSTPSGVGTIMLYQR